MTHATPETIRLVGGSLCLDFVNTTEWAGPGIPRDGAMDVFGEPDALTRWGRRLGVLAPRARVAVSDAELASARDLRAAIHEVFAAVAAGDGPSEEGVDRLGAVYADAVRAGRMRSGDEGWRLTWPDDAAAVRYAAVADAVALLTDTSRLRRVRQCPGRNCGGLFVDLSGQRKWCSMEACGSREKMRRLYHRQKAAARPRGAGQATRRPMPG